LPGKTRAIHIEAGESSHGDIHHPRAPRELPAATIQSSRNLGSLSRRIRGGSPGKGKVEAMPLVQLVEVLVVVGVVLWLVNRFIPMQRTIKSILNAVVVIAVVLWILNVSGLLHSFTGIRIGK
jgi:hypothetical protein